MNDERLLSATPVLAFLDIERSASFYATHFGFKAQHVEQGVYGVVTRDDVGLHFWACSDRHIAENTSCRFRTTHVDGLVRTLQGRGHRSSQCSPRKQAVGSDRVCDHRS